MKKKSAYDKKHSKFSSRQSVKIILFSLFCSLDILRKNTTLSFRGQPAEFYNQVLVAEHMGISVGMAMIKFHKDKWHGMSKYIYPLDWGSKGCNAWIQKVLSKGVQLCWFLVYEGGGGGGSSRPSLTLQQNVI